MSHQSMSAHERSIRSQLHKLLYDQPVLRGSLNVRKITCGSKGCRCASGQTHDTLYLTYRDSRDERKHQVSIPHELDDWVHQCAGNYHRILELLDELCAISCEVIESHKAKRKAEDA